MALVSEFISKLYLVFNLLVWRRVNEDNVLSNKVSLDSSLGQHCFSLSRVHCNCHQLNIFTLSENINKIIYFLLLNVKTWVRIHVSLCHFLKSCVVIACGF